MQIDFTLCLNLAKARELLLLEAKSHMPPGASAQRKAMVTAIEAILTDALAGQAIPPLGPDADAISGSAHTFLAGLPGSPTVLPKTPYEGLKTLFALRSHLGLSSEIIHWLQSTHSLPHIPPEAIEDALSAISIFSHRLLARPETQGWLKALIDEPQALDELSARNLSLMMQQWIQEAGLSEDFVGELERANLASFRVWETAKAASDFSGWLPYFTQVVRLAVQKGKQLGNAMKVAPYQALLEHYNAGLSNDTVNRIFTQLHGKLPGLIQRIQAKQSAEKATLPLPPVTLDTQRKIVGRIIRALGFDPNVSRIDESLHPFSTGEWDDVRVTTRYHEDNLLSGIMSVVHEMGHLFYSRNLPRVWKNQPIGAAQSMWIHESQSLFWEKQMGCSYAFMQFLNAIITQELGHSPEWSAANLYATITRVRPGLIRIEADEVTYPAHIILRHNIEQRLVTGDLQPQDLPHVWAEQMQLLLGVTVPDHAHGAMQDVHWTDGSFGYFPAYSFGALAAAQFMETARVAIPDMDNNIRSGDFAAIRRWLREHIHEMGSRYDGEELVERVTGKLLSITPWLAHVQARYL